MSLAGNRFSLLKNIFEGLSVLSYFVLIIIMQIIVVKVYQLTGVLLAMVGSFSVAKSAVLLPLISLSIIPCLYLIRHVVVHTNQVAAEDYIVTAKSKGFPRLYIYIHHVFRNVVPFIKADLHKLVGIMIGNLFIVEYLFNLRGATQLLFSASFKHLNLFKGYLSGYQYSLVANTFFAIVLLYFLIMERGLARE